MRDFIIDTLETILTISFVAIIILGMVLGNAVVPSNESEGIILGGIIGFLIAVLTTGMAFVLLSIDKTLKSISSKLSSSNLSTVGTSKASQTRSHQSSQSTRSGKGTNKNTSGVTYKSMIKYEGVDIKYNFKGKAFALGKTFDSLDEAKEYIDQH